MNKYQPQIHDEILTIQTNATDKDMQQFNITVLSIVALVILAMVLIYAMRRP